MTTHRCPGFACPRCAPDAAEREMRATRKESEELRVHIIRITRDMDELRKHNSIGTCQLAKAEKDRDDYKLAMLRISEEKDVAVRQTTQYHDRLDDALDALSWATIKLRHLGVSFEKGEKLLSENEPRIDTQASPVDCELCRDIGALVKSHKKDHARKDLKS